MLTRLQLVVLGMVVVHGIDSNAMEKRPESPRMQLAVVLRSSAELSKQEQELKNRTNAISVPLTKTRGSSISYRYPGSSSPVETWIPYPYCYGECDMRLSDCP